jgi:hypothetical protein
LKQRGLVESTHGGVALEEHIEVVSNDARTRNVGCFQRARSTLEPVLNCEAAPGQLPNEYTAAGCVELVHDLVAPLHELWAARPPAAVLIDVRWNHLQTVELIEVQGDEKRSGVEGGMATRDGGAKLAVCPELPERHALHILKEENCTRAGAGSKPVEMHEDSNEADSARVLGVVHELLQLVKRVEIPQLHRRGEISFHVMLDTLLDGLLQGLLHHVAVIMTAVAESPHELLVVFFTLVLGCRIGQGGPALRQCV